jgi:hypothetical protein
LSGRIGLELSWPVFSVDTLRRRYTRESATLMHVLGLQGDIPIGPPKPLRARSLTDKVSMYEVDRR